MKGTWIKKHQLDTPLCDIFPGTITDRTVREYVRIGEKILGWNPINIDVMECEELNVYVDLIAYKIDIEVVD